MKKASSPQSSCLRYELRPYNHARGYRDKDSGACTHPPTDLKISRSHVLAVPGASFFSFVGDTPPHVVDLHVPTADIVGWLSSSSVEAVRPNVAAGLDAGWMDEVREYKDGVLICLCKDRKKKNDTFRPPVDLFRRADLVTASRA